MGGSSTDGHYRRLLKRSPSGLLITALDGEILAANEAAAAALGYDRPDELVATNIRDRYADPARRKSLLRRIRKQGEVRDAEFEMRTREGETAYLLVSVKKESHPDFEEEVLLTSWVDITDERELRDRLQHLAKHDDLTGLLNRRALFERSEQVFAMCERENRRAAVLYIDLVGFQEVNEKLGHDGGDRLLKAVGERLRDTMRDADLVARIGGDEFVVVATLIRDGEDADQVGRRVLYAFEEEVEDGDHPIRLRPAIGIAVYPEDGTDMDTLLHRSDRALWGPNRKKPPGMRRYHAGVDGVKETGTSWDVPSELNRALRNGRELFQVYQPIVASDTAEPVGLESLVRWDHSEHGLLTPAAFLPDAEASGLVRQLDRRVFRESVGQATAWVESGVPLDWVSVNLSAQSLSHPESVEWIHNALKESRLPDSIRVVVEITEHTAMQQVTRNDVLQRLRDEVGVSISIDDFGVGYSSFLYLRQFPAQFLKIDLEFVRDVVTSEADQKVVEGIIALGEAFDVEVIAEGVETEAQMEWLREAGCDYLQGYYFGRPAPADEIMRRFAER